MRRRSFLAGGTALHGLARPHGVCCNFIRVRVENHGRGEFDGEAKAASLIEIYGARIAALEPMVGRLAFENEREHFEAARTRGFCSGATD